MNKKITLLSLLFSIGILGLFLANNTSSDSYKPRQKAVHGIAGYAEYIAMIRNNEITGKVTDEMVSGVKKQMHIEQAKQQKTEWPLRWSFSGPDNVGGRTRAMVIDKDDPKILYAGGVSGSLFKSVNGGASWTPITIESEDFGITSMAQSLDGAIFYGTGEGTFVSWGAAGAEEGTPGFASHGMFKSTDGETFTRLNNTLAFGNINVLTAHPTKNIILAGTQAGLYYTANGGTDWIQIRAGSCRDVKVNKNGVVLAYIGQQIFRSTNAEDKDSYTALTGQFGANNRMAIAWSESNPEYCYVVSVGSVTIENTAYGSALNGLYKSTDAGQNFTKIVNSASKYFAPFTNLGVQSQGTYDMAIGVHPRNPDRVFIGGVGFAEWTPDLGPRIVGNNFDSPLNPFGIHADKHAILFDNTGEVPIMYVLSDGGVARTTNEELDRYKHINNGYITTQFYGIAASTSGVIIGGTQDNSTQKLTKESFPTKFGEEILGGDGFQCEISQLNEDIMFAESYNGSMRRSVNGGNSMSSIWDNRIRSEFVSNTQVNNIFNTAMHLWENPDAIERFHVVGEDSITEAMYQARLFYCTNQSVWMANNATGTPHIADNPSNTTVRWFKIAGVSNVHHMTTSRDGNSLFIGTTTGRIYRVDGLNKANWDTTELTDKKAISDSLTISNITGSIGIGSRTVTSLALDPNDDTRLVVTVGNYGNSTFVYLTNNALDPVPTWKNIQSNLPQFPVYHAIINREDPDIIVLGTEYGVWACTNGTSGVPTWAQMLDGVDPDLPLPQSPVFDLVQVAEKNWTGSRIYAGTHGMGIWESASLLTGVEDERTVKAKVDSKAYPNPASNRITLETGIKGEYQVNIYDMSGNLLESFNGAGNGIISIETLDYANGTYFFEVIGADSKSVSKVLIQH